MLSGLKFSRYRYQKKEKTIEDGKILNIQKIDYAPNQKSGLMKKYFDPKNQALICKEIKKEKLPESNFGISVAGWHSNFWFKFFF